MDKNLNCLGQRGALLLGASCFVFACGSVEPPADTADGASSGILTQGTPTSDSNAESGEGSQSGDSSGSQTAGPASQTSGGEETTESSDIKFDLGDTPDVPAGQGVCQPGVGKGGKKVEGPDFSYLWAANSSEGTITKIDTETVTEVGRFQVRPDGAGSPSRTSVSLSGNVAVASRSGGVTKFFASVDDCVESNGTPGIQTSMNNAALPWDQEECRAWHTPFGYTTQRPVAWAQGEWNSTTCEWENELLWTAGRNGSIAAADVILLDGDDGTVVDMVTIDDLHADQYGIYGAAVDSEGNFWGSQLSGRRLIKVNMADMSTEVWTPPGPGGYGMTVDVDGYVWICASTLQRYDPATDTWANTASGIGSSGCMADGAEGGLIWAASGGFIRGVNRETLMLEQAWPVPGSYGVSIDFAGNVWAVAFGDGAHRVDPLTGDVTSYYGLVGAYTYSDMTGAALSSVTGVGPTG